MSRVRFSSDGLLVLLQGLWLTNYLQYVKPLAEAETYSRIIRVKFS
jgi:hypothetical protein